MGEGKETKIRKSDVVLVDGAGEVVVDTAYESYTVITDLPKRTVE